MAEIAGRQPVPISIYEREATRFSPEARRALDIIEPCVRLTNRAEAKLNEPLPGNNPVRAETSLPPGVVLQSELEGLGDAEVAEQVRAATRIITAREEASFFEIGADAGVNRPDDISLQDVGLPGDALQTAEGGKQDTKLVTQKAKMIGDPVPAEPGHGLVVKTEERPTGRMVQCATRARNLGGKDGEAEAVRRMVQAHQDEIARSRHVLEFLEVDPAAPATEYDGAVLTWITDERFVPAERPRIIGHIDVDAVPGGVESRGSESGRTSSGFTGNRVGAVGNLVEIGSLNGRPVYIQEVPREYLYEAPGKVALSSKGAPRYVQPNASQMAVAHARIFREQSAAVVTSATYLLEHIVEAAEETYDIAMRGEPAVHVMPVAYGTRRVRAATGREPNRLGLAHMLGALGKAQRIAETFYAKVLLNESRAA